MADALHMVMDSDRAVYTRRIVNRLASKEKVITASEHFEDEKALVLPAQMFRFGAEMVAEKAEANPEVNFSYSLQSIWPINKQNAPQTEAEIEGLQFVADNKGQNYYATEELGGTNYFTAVCCAAKEIVRFFYGSIISNHSVAVVVHIEDQVLAHDCKADKCDVCLSVHSDY